MKITKIYNIYEVANQNLFIYILFHNVLDNINYFPKNNIQETYKTLKNIDYCKKINIYSLSSFNYTFMGLYLLINPLKIKVFNYFYPFNLCVQGFISFLSDSVYIDKDHWSHNYDVSFALYNTIIALYLFTKYKITFTKMIILIWGLSVQKLASYYLKKKK
tara:strand:- start:354 stop:836 length:483 start_codon:yes stop_codon:yes gene_type:complete